MYYHEKLCFSKREITSVAKNKKKCIQSFETTGPGMKGKGRGGATTENLHLMEEFGPVTALKYL